jgi:hypothetical protein
MWHWARFSSSTAISPANSHSINGSRYINHLIMDATILKESLINKLKITVLMAVIIMVMKMMVIMISMFRGEIEI